MRSLAACNLSDVEGMSGVCYEVRERDLALADALDAVLRPHYGPEDSRNCNFSFIEYGSGLGFVGTTLASLYPGTCARVCARLHARTALILSLCGPGFIQHHAPSRPRLHPPPRCAAWAPAHACIRSISRTRSPPLPPHPPIPRYPKPYTLNHKQGAQWCRWKATWPCTGSTQHICATCT